MQEFKFLNYQINSQIAEIIINRPPINAFNIRLLDEILSSLELAKNDRTVRAVLIKSNLEKIFCAGLDLDILIDKPILKVREFLERLYVKLWDIQYNMGKPTIAVVNGSARGGGMTLAISCDVILASEDASFGYPEINLGLPPAIHFIHLPKIIGRYKAFELLFSGQTFGTKEAFSMGLINNIFVKSKLNEEAEKLALIFSQKSANSMRSSRAAFMRANDFDYRRSVANAVEDFCNATVTPDAQEGLKAFLEKRTPNWD